MTKWLQWSLQALKTKGTNINQDFSLVGAEIDAYHHHFSSRLNQILYNEHIQHTAYRVWHESDSVCRLCVGLCFKKLIKLFLC